MTGHSSEEAVARTPGKDTLTSHVQLMPTASTPTIPPTMKRLQLKSAGSAARPSGQSFINGIFSGTVQRKEEPGMDNHGVLAAAAVRPAAAPALSGSIAGTPVQCAEQEVAAHPDVSSIAAGGLTGASTALPHADQIQASFGRHSIAGINAHVGGPAADASAALGAQAYATGSSIAFSKSPDLHTAAHEAAHVIQQRAGVHLKGGMGERGDVHEQHADAVADKVVRGESAEALLDQYGGSGGGGVDAGGHLDAAPGGKIIKGTTSRGQVQLTRSWLGDRVDLVRKAVRDGNFAGSDPPGAFYVLNGLSLEDMIEVIAKLNANERKILSEHMDDASSFDRGRIFMAFQQAQTKSNWWREQVEAVHWAIRQGSFGQYPDGAFWKINPLNAHDIDHLMTLLDRDHLDELIAHQDQGTAVPNIAHIIRAASQARAARGVLPVEKQIVALVEQARKAPDKSAELAKKIFVTLRGLNDAALTRLIRGSRPVADFLLANLHYAEGIENADRIRQFVAPKESSDIDLNMDVHAPGLDLTILNLRKDPSYLDQQVIAIAYGIYVGGFLMFVQNLDKPILVPEKDVFFGGPPLKPLNETIYPSRQAADEAVHTAGHAQETFAYFHGAGGAVIAPTIINDSTAPRVIAMARECLLKLKAQVQDELTVMAIMLVGGALFNCVARGFSKWVDARAARVRAQAAKEVNALGEGGAFKAPEGSGAEPSAAEQSAAEGAPAVTVRPHATQQQLADMIANHNEWYTWRTDDYEVVANQNVRQTGKNTGTAKGEEPDVPEVCLVRGLEGVGYGPYHVSVRGANYRIRGTSDAVELRLDGEIPANEGVWYTDKELARAKGK